MARRAGSGRNTVKKRSNKTVKLRHAKTKIASGRSSADPQEQIGALRRELIEARKQQTATSKILGVISRSPDDLRPVFDAIVQNAGRLCESTNVSLFRVEAELMRHVASHGDAVTLGPGATRPLTRGSLAGRAIIDGKTIHIDDSRAPAIVAEFPDAQPAIAQTGIRTSLAVPLLKGTIVLGAIVVRRTEVRPFSDEQIELVQNFAAQAVIAIENTRLLNELRESLRQQTATADVLKTISRSTFDLQSVLTTLAQSATRLCDADAANIWLPSGGHYRLAADYGLAPDYKARLRNVDLKPDGQSVVGRTLQARQTQHIPDMMLDPEYAAHDLERLGGYRGMLGVPLMREGFPVGVLMVGRTSPRPFTNAQIELVTTFADQAVIAIENTRLLNELRQRTGDLSEALEQQTATSEVLKAISNSPGELDPVFQTMLKNATRVCDASFGVMFRHERNRFRVAAMLDLPPRFAEFLLQDDGFVPPPPPGSVLERACQTKQVVATADGAAHPTPSPAATIGGARSTVAVPMLKDNDLVGAFVIYRQEVRPFTDKQIELVKNFAAQAVIAIENTRLLNELRDSLQQQTATSEVLQVISRSTFNLQSVFDTLIESAARLCHSDRAGIRLVRDGFHHQVACHGFSPEQIEYLKKTPLPIDRGNTVGRAVLEARPIHIADAQNDPDFVIARQSRMVNVRTILAMPLMREGEVIGALTLTRNVVQPFTTQQIGLIETFAAQAVIAIENVRLFDEVQKRTDDLSEALEQQTATSEVLQVISSSPGDLEPVFASILANATRICEAGFGNLWLREGHEFRCASTYGAPPQYLAQLQRQLRPSPGTLVARVIETKQAVQMDDMSKSRAYLDGDPVVVASVDIAGTRTLVSVPMLKDDELIGVIAIYRREVRPFSNKQIDLVRNFAAQAVIAIENARLLNELRQRTDDLTESLEQQTATSEVLKVISASQGELEPVFNTMLENAVRICGAQLGNLALYDGRNMRVAAMHNPPPAYQELRRREPVAPSGNRSLLGVIAASKSVMRFDDLTVEPYVSWALPKLAGAKSAVGVPMLRDGELAGAIVIYRTELRAFTDKQIELVKNFAAQAVIAIENARLLNELRQRTDDLSESLEQQTATSDVLKVISSSPGELEPVFNAMLAKATRICEAKVGNMFLREGDGFRAVAVHGDSDYAEWFRREPLVAQLAGSPLDRLIRTKQLIHIPDLRQDQSYIDGHPRMVSLVDTAGARTHLVVPMLKEDELIGAIVIYRQEVRPFTDKQIELVQNFAAQAVIAIENARLLNELRQRTDDLTESLEYQTAIGEILGVISKSPTNVQPVFDIITASAVRLCGATWSGVLQYDGDLIKLGALHNLRDFEGAEALRQSFPRKPSASGATDRAVTSRATCYIRDVREVTDYAHQDLVQSINYRSVLSVPMLREGDAIGAITVVGVEPNHFTDRQVALLRTFADQAVIAIENVRLFDEVQKRTEDLSESLEQQTATSEVLKVISSSPGNLQSVFQAMLDNATRICGAGFGTLFRIENDEMEPVAHHNVPAVLVKHLTDRGRIKPRPGSTMQRVVRSRDVVHVVDLLQDPDAPGNPAVQFAGARTYLGVPMLKEGELVGAIVIYRLEVRPFTGKQIELVQNFAAQAVIAIENTRLLNELRESLQQQTATADVLKVISSSPGELEPVFQAMLENAVRICGAKFGNMFRYENGEFYPVARLNLPPALDEFLQRRGRRAPNPGTVLEEMWKSKKILHTLDDAASPSQSPPALLGGARTHLAVPMLKDDELVGAITIYRQEVRPFEDKQIQLVQNFAAQAVIAIENTRLLNELRQRTDDLSEALEQQTATSEVLKVISSSPGDLKPVFDVLLSNATRMCGAKFGALSLYDGEVFRSIAMMGAPPAFAGRMERDPIIRVTPGHNLERLVHTKAFVHIPDLEIDRNAAPIPYELAGARAALNVPLLKDNALIGSLLIYRQEKGAFNAKQIELVQSFAAQAVIAIENTRLLNELRQRTDDLSESLEQQTATSEVLKVISSSPGELEPVFRVMLENATRLCEAKFGMLFRCEGDQFRFETAYNTPPALTEFQRQRGLFRSSPGASLDRLLQARQVVRSADDREEAVPSPSSKLGGARSHVVVPMFKDNELVGAITIYRQEVRPFTDKQIELVQNFAAQAVIAIENTRLLNELRESLQQQTATADVLKIISRSTFDLKTVLNTLVESAARLSESDFATLNRQHADGYRQVASYGLTASAVQMIEASPLKAGRGSIVGRTLMERKPIQIVDVLSDPEFEMIEATKRIGSNTILGVPLMREGEPIGVMTLQRRSKQPYTDKQIELLTTFADQAVIAIENVRLFESVQTRTRELAQSLEDLQSAQDRLVQTQKLASLGQLTAGIAHEIKNPLNFVNNFSAVSTELIDELQDILKGASVNDKARSDINELTDTLRGNLEKIVQHGKRADSIVKNMLLHSREGSGEHRPVDINAIVEESLNLAYHGARAEKQGFNITLERSFDPAAGEVDLFPQEITRVMLNLISNGFYAATKRKGEIGRDGYEPTLAAATKSLGDSVEIRIRDNGTGIPPEVKEKMFNPFFTTKPAGEGTGLGLSLSYDIIVKQHAGSIEVDTQPGEFTEFRIVLPRGAATVAKSGERS